MPPKPPGQQSAEKPKKKSKHEINLENTDIGNWFKERSQRRVNNTKPQRVAALQECQEMHECFLASEQVAYTEPQVESILFMLEFLPERIHAAFLLLPKVRDEVGLRNASFWTRNRLNEVSATLASNVLLTWAFESEAVEIAAFCVSKDEESRMQLSTAREEMKLQRRNQRAELVLDSFESAIAAAEPSNEAYQRGRQKLELGIETEQKLIEFNETLAEQLGCNDPRSTTPLEGVEIIREAIQIVIDVLHLSVEFCRERIEEANLANQRVAKTAEIADGFKKSYQPPVTKEEGLQRAMKRNQGSQDKYLERMKKSQEKKNEEERLAREAQMKWRVTPAESK